MKYYGVSNMLFIIENEKV